MSFQDIAAENGENICIIYLDTFCAESKDDRRGRTSLI